MRFLHSKINLTGDQAVVVVWFFFGFFALNENSFSCYIHWVLKVLPPLFRYRYGGFVFCLVYFRFILFNLPFPQLLLLFYTKVFTKEASVFLTVIPDPSWLGSCCNSEAPVTLSGPLPGLQVMSGIALSSEKKKGGKHACFFFLCQHNGLSSWWALNSSLPRRRGLTGSGSIHLLSGAADDVMTVRSSSETLLRVILVCCLTSHLTRRPLLSALAALTVMAGV